LHGVHHIVQLRNGLGEVGDGLVGIALEESEVRRGGRGGVAGETGETRDKGRQLRGCERRRAAEGGRGDLMVGCGGVLAQTEPGVNGRRGQGGSSHGVI
jgi:hypothetical protein